MDLDDYIQPGEKIYCRTNTKAKGYTADELDDGALACTDSRLIFVSGRDVTDIDLQSVEVIEYTSRNIPLRYLLGAAAMFVIGILGYFFIPEITQIPNSTGIFAMLFGSVVAVGALVDAYRIFGPQLVVRTSRSTHQFVHGDLADFPHAIRGAS